MRVDKTPGGNIPEPIASRETKEKDLQVGLPEKSDLPGKSGKPVDIQKVMENVNKLSKESLPTVLQIVQNTIKNRKSMYVSGEGGETSRTISSIITQATKNLESK